MARIKDGDPYKKIKIGDRVFDIRYGYYEEFERQRNDPVPIYPNFIKEPICIDGCPLVTAMQDVCEHLDGTDPELGCLVCKHYERLEDMIGKCTLA